MGPDNSINTVNSNTPPVQHPVQQPDQYQGVSNPPNGGQVTTTDTSQSGTQAQQPSGTNPPLTAQTGQNPPQSQTAQGAGAGKSVQSTPPNSQSQASQTGQSQSGQTQKQPTPVVKKAPTPPTTTSLLGVNTTPQEQEQSRQDVVKNSRLRDALLTLTGGQRVQYSPQLDANGNPTGVIEAKPAPISTRKLAFGLAMQAVMGGLAGMGAHGPGRLGQAAQAGMAVGMKQAETVKDQNDQSYTQAQNAIKIKQSAVQAAFATRAASQEVGMRDEETHKNWISSHAPTADFYTRYQPDKIINQSMTESEVTDPAFVKKMFDNGWVAIPIKYVPRYDNNGQHFTQDGVAMHDDLYMVVDARGGAKMPDALLQKAQKYNIAGLSSYKPKEVGPDGVHDLDVQTATLSNISNQVTAMENEQQDLNEYYGYLNEHGATGADGKPLVAPDLAKMSHDQPSIVAAITGPWANHFGNNPMEALKAMKDGTAGKGVIANLYGGQNLMDKFDQFKDGDKKSADNDAKFNGPLNPDTATNIVSDPTKFGPDRVKAAQSYLDTYNKEQADLAASRAKAEAPYKQSTVDAGDSKDNATLISDGIRNGDQPPNLTGIDRKTAAQVRADLEKKGYNLTQATFDYDALRTRLHSLNSGQQVAMQQAVYTASDAVDLLAQKYDDWKNAMQGLSGFKVLNAAALKASMQLPGAAGKAAHLLEAQIADTNAEMSKVYMGGNSPTDRALELASHNFSGSWNPDTFEGAINQAHQNIAIRRNSFIWARNSIGVNGTNQYQQNQPNQPDQNQNQNTNNNQNANQNTNLPPVPTATQPRPAGAVSRGFNRQDNKWHYLDANGNTLGEIK